MRLHEFFLNEFDVRTSKLFKKFDDYKGTLYTLA